MAHPHTDHIEVVVEVHVVAIIVDWPVGVLRGGV
jgi:hypothetical protein